MTEETKTEIRNVTADEFAEAYRSPGVFVNKIVLTLQGPFARLTFFERREQDTQVYSYARATVVMPLGDLVEMRDLLNQMSDKIKLVDIPVPAAANGNG